MERSRIIFSMCIGLIVALIAPPLAAQSVKVVNAWARATVPGQKTAGAYLELTSDAGAALVAAGSPLAERVELHAMSMDGGVMRMRALPHIDLPAGQTVKLAPGGLHLMLLEIKRPLKVGDKLPLVLSVQSAGPSAGSSLTTLKIEAEVRSAGDTGQTQR